LGEKDRTQFVIPPKFDDPNQPLLIPFATRLFPVLSLRPRDYVMDVFWGQDWPGQCDKLMVGGSLPRIGLGPSGLRARENHPSATEPFSRRIEFIDELLNIICE